MYLYADNKEFAQINFLSIFDPTHLSVEKRTGNKKLRTGKTLRNN